MRELGIKRLRFSVEADTWLKVLKTRTGMTPNLLCRAAFCLSLAEPGLPPDMAGEPESQREINRYTLLGEYDVLFEALLRQRMATDGLVDAEIDDQFRRHMHRGIALLSSRTRSLPDLMALAEHAGRPS